VLWLRKMGTPGKQAEWFVVALVFIQIGRKSHSLFSNIHCSSGSWYIQQYSPLPPPPPLSLPLLQVYSSEDSCYGFLNFDTVTVWLCLKERSVPDYVTAGKINLFIGLLLSFELPYTGLYCTGC